jgi:hypothetical protein
MGTPMLIPVAIRAAAALSSERERQTLDNLLTWGMALPVNLWQLSFAGNDDYSGREP